MENKPINCKEEILTFEERRKIINRTTLNQYSSSEVEITDPLILEFYRTLKNQKIFGLFSRFYSFRKISSTLKSDILERRRIENRVIGNLYIRLNSASEFFKRIKIIRASVKENNYTGKENWTKIEEAKYLEAYAREYFKNKKIPIKHNQIYFQCMFGIINVLIGLSLISSVIYYFWGGIAIVSILILFCIYSGLLIYKLHKFNFFNKSDRK